MSDKELRELVENWKLILPKGRKSGVAVDMRDPFRTMRKFCSTGKGEGATYGGYLKSGDVDYEAARELLLRHGIKEIES